MTADPVQGSLCRPWYGRCPGPSRSSAKCRKVVLALSVGILLSVVYRGGVTRVSFSEEHKYIGNEDKRIVSGNRESSKKPQKYSDAEERILLPEREFVKINLKPYIISESKGDFYMKKSTRTTTMEFGGETASTDYLNIHKKGKLGSINTYLINPFTVRSALPSVSNASPTFNTTNTTTSTTAYLAATTASFVDLATASSRPNFKQQNKGDETKKNILFYTNFFHGSWENFLKERTSLIHTCPVSSCRFLFDSSHPEEADAVVFHAKDIKMESVPSVRRPNQLYIWLNMESPDEVGSIRGLRVKPQRKSYRKIVKKDDEKLYGRPAFFNWTFTYHRDSDLLLLYGGLWPLKGEGVADRPGLLNTTGSTYRDYVAALDRGELMQEDTRQDLSTFLTRPKLVVWMASHCSTLSGREFYVRELQRHLQVDVFGLCGNLRCGKTRMDIECYSRLLRPNYKFYLSFENNMCQDYITEKVWMALQYGLVPVVYGGTRYADFLPPHSYVDATLLTPHQLAQLLDRVGNSPELYGRYHLWRNYWKVLLRPPFCELCLKLHQNGARNDEEETGRRQYKDLRKWWLGVNNCSSRYPLDRYPRPPEPDTRPLLQKLKDVFGYYVGVATAALPIARQQT